jgi:hypothetical protein
MNDGVKIGAPMKMICDIDRKCVAIVRFGPSGFPTDGHRAGEYFQVTIDPDRVSPSGDYIRFGLEHEDGKIVRGEGDEIHGWQRCEAMCVVEVLGEWDGDNSPILTYGKTVGVTEII